MRFEAVAGERAANAYQKPLTDISESDKAGTNTGNRTFGQRPFASTFHKSKCVPRCSRGAFWAMATEMFFMEDVVMSRKHFSRHDEPLNSDDLRKCQAVLNAICGDFGIEPGSEEADRIAAITIELYQQGVRDVRHLEHIVDAARGLDLRARGTKA
ncbi:hypothetical protein ACXHXM_32440